MFKVQSLSRKLMNRTGLSGLLAIGTLVFVSFSVTLANPTDDEMLDQELQNVSLNGDTIGGILQDLAYSHGIPLGFESYFGKELQCRLKKESIQKLAFERITLRRLLVKIQSETQNCEWAFADGVVNFYDSSGSMKLRDQTLFSFEIKLGESKGDIKQRIMRSVEIQSILLSTDKEYAFLSISKTDNDSLSPDFFVKEGNYVVGELLNKIVRETPVKYWRLGNWENKEELIFLGF